MSVWVSVWGLGLRSERIGGWLEGLKPSLRVWAIGLFLLEWRCCSLRWLAWECSKTEEFSCYFSLYLVSRYLRRFSAVICWLDW